MKKKIKIMRRGPELSDEEIQSHMDFEGLVSNVSDTIALRYRKLFLRWGISSVVLLGVLLSYYFYLPNNNPKKQSTPIRQKQPAALTHPSRNDSSLTKSERDAEKKRLPEKSALPSGNAQLRATVPVPSVKNETQPANETLYVQAEPLQGYPALYEYFSSQLVYPKEALHDSIQGIETISLVINIEGKPEQIRIVQSLGEPFEKEAIRLIQNMPAWKPSTLNGKPVPSKISLPITFQIKRFPVKK